MARLSGPASDEVVQVRNFSDRAALVTTLDDGVTSLRAMVRGSPATP
jgi:hypothetical protein